MKARFAILLGIFATSAISSTPASGAESNGPANSPCRSEATQRSFGTRRGRRVTARKRNEKLLDVPETIAAFSAPDIAAKGIETPDDLGRQVANLQFGMRQDLTPDIVIRGVRAYGIVAGVGFTIDDVPNFTDQTMRIEDIESIQVKRPRERCMVVARSGRNRLCDEAT